MPPVLHDERSDTPSDSREKAWFHNDEGKEHNMSLAWFNRFLCAEKYQCNYRKLQNVFQQQHSNVIYRQYGYNMVL